MSNTSASTNPTETLQSITLLVNYCHAFQGSVMPGDPNRFQFANKAEFETYKALKVQLPERAELVDSDTGREIDRINIFKMIGDKHLEIQPFERKSYEPINWGPVVSSIPNWDSGN